METAGPLRKRIAERTAGREAISIIVVRTLKLADKGRGSIPLRRTVPAAIMAPAMQIADLLRRPGVEIPSGIQWRIGDLWDPWHIAAPVGRWDQCMVATDSGWRGASRRNVLARHSADLPEGTARGSLSSALARQGLAHRWDRALDRPPARASAMDLRPSRDIILAEGTGSTSVRVAMAGGVRRWPLLEEMGSAKGLGLPAAGRCAAHKGPRRAALSIRE